MRQRLLSAVVIAFVLAVKALTLSGAQEPAAERSLSTACYDALMSLFGVGDPGAAAQDAASPGKVGQGKQPSIQSRPGAPQGRVPDPLTIECTINTADFDALSGKPRFPSGPHTLSARIVGAPPLRDGAPDPRGFSITFEGRSFFVPMTNAPAIVRASVDPQLQAVTVSWPGTVTVPPVAGAAADTPTISIFVTSRGELGAGAVRAVVVNHSGAPVTLQPGVVALEPIRQVNGSDLQRELTTLSAFPQVTVTLDAYCLERQKAAPSAGTVYRVAPAPLQATNEPVGRLLSAAQRLRNAKMLEPDTDPDDYFHSIVQWAIWTEQEKFDQRAFTAAFTAYTRKNVVEGGQRWTRDIEDAVREIAPQRWRDISRIVDETRKASPKE